MADPEASPEISSATEARFSEDWLANLIGGCLLLISLIAVLVAMDQKQVPAESALPPEPAAVVNPLQDCFTKPLRWSGNPLDAWRTNGQLAWPKLLGTFVTLLAVMGIGVKLQGQSGKEFSRGFLFVFLLALVALTIAANAVVKGYNLEYALWALGLGLLISNTLGTPAIVKPAVLTEFYIKTGLVLYGAKVLFSTLLQLGLPGLCVAWIVTPIVLISTYWFGQKVLRISSQRLNMVISADMSVCGVSAAIATAAACRAKKEELTLAVGISLTFTVVMMIVLPLVARLLGMDEIVAGAWIGGTIDSTGAVGAAGEMISPAAGNAAITIKLIQNVLIGVLAFGVALYWVRRVEPDQAGVQPDGWEIWRRFPKFVLGFLAASIVFSAVHALLPRGPEIVTATLKGMTETLRSWLFAMAFVSIGLASNFRELSKTLQGGKPLLLYLCGQTLNLCLTLAMAWLMFAKLFPDAGRGLVE